MSDFKTFHFSKLTSFIDEAFVPTNVNYYTLHLQISLASILATVIDKSKNKFIAFEHYTFQHCFNYEILANGLEPIINQSKLLHQKYKTINCILVNNLSTLVPEALYDEDRKKLFLKFNHFLQGDEMVYDNKLRNADIRCVFALPFLLKSKLEMTYNLASFYYYHSSTCLIDTLQMDSKNQAGKRLYVNVENKHLEVIVIENISLVYYNSFNYFSAEDFLYYLLFVCEQLHLNPETQQLFLLGEIERNSSLFSLIQKYIRTVTFLNRFSSVEYSYQLQTLPIHSYFSLFTNNYN